MEDTGNPYFHIPPLEEHEIFKSQKELKRWRERSYQRNKRKEIFQK